MRKVLAAAAICAALATQANAGGLMSCTVADPTGTPLNVRTGPNGGILGALHNGTLVVITDLTVARGKKWAKVIPTGSGKPGWAFFSHLEDCH